MEWRWSSLFPQHSGGTKRRQRFLKPASELHNGDWVSARGYFGSIKHQHPRTCQRYSSSCRKRQRIPISVNHSYPNSFQVQVFANIEFGKFFASVSQISSHKSRLRNLLRVEDFQYPATASNGLLPWLWAVAIERRE